MIILQTVPLPAHQLNNDSIKGHQIYMFPFQSRLVLFLAACPAATGPVKCRRFPSTALPSQMRTHSLTQASFDTSDQLTEKKYNKKTNKFSSCINSAFTKKKRILNYKSLFLALQCRLECEPGYVAQRTPLITCVNGEYAKGCHYLQKLIIIRSFCFLSNFLMGVFF